MSTWRFHRSLWFIVVLVAVAAACARQPAPAPAHSTAAASAEPGGAVARSTPVPAERRVATLAGGCFWGMEELLRKIPGVVDTEVGYTGGRLSQPTYDRVKRGDTGHAESVRVVFDPAQVSYAEILETFFRIHDPTTRDRQGNDTGSQYRSAIFYHSEAQRKTALQVIEKVENSGVWKAPIVTQVVAAGTFTPAEDFHQDYLQKHPGGYTCHYERPYSF
jgi:peptide methionine sulfoxide reductase msrA/msrB